jgi:hypothetical protein
MQALTSWRSIAEAEGSTAPLANCVPDILRHTDLPQITRSIAPRPVIFAREEKWSFEVLSQL